MEQEGGLMKFSVLSTAPSGIRHGILSKGSYKVTTPTTLLTTSRMAVPHLTLDRLRKVAFGEGGKPRVAGIQLYLDKFLENPSLCQTIQIPIAQFASLQVTNQA